MTIQITSALGRWHFQCWKEPCASRRRYLISSRDYCIKVKWILIFWTLLRRLFPHILHVLPTRGVIVVLRCSRTSTAFAWPDGFAIHPSGL